MAGDKTDQRAKNSAAASDRTAHGGEPGSDSRQGGMRAAGMAASRIAARVVARGGGGTLARLKSEWSAIIGSEIAALTWPESLGRDGALKLRVAPAFALELQHRAPLFCERIDLFFGRQIVTRLVLVQGPLPLPAPPAKPRQSWPSGGDAVLDSRLDNIADPELRAALEGLRRLVLAAEPQSE